MNLDDLKGLTLKELSDKVGEMAKTEAEATFPGMVYFNTEGKLSHAEWDAMLETFGEDGYMILAMSETPEWKRGQFVLTPEAMKRYTEVRRAKMN
jgi:hypothetical protein